VHIEGQAAVLAALAELVGAAPVPVPVDVAAGSVDAVLEVVPLLGMGSEPESAHAMTGTAADTATNTDQSIVWVARFIEVRVI
jgi:hypothetical protein